MAAIVRGIWELHGSASAAPRDVDVRRVRLVTIVANLGISRFEASGGRN